ncbi:MAG: TetR/AcrR family transcriptional regulator [Kordiimonadaceae bacterium]|nr:TetR/AcrR family transcriptional regulator [Kordiimonadaceae bacterium]
MARPSRRDHIIDVAIVLFCEHGFHATGVDKIMRTAQVSKKTLYNHFRSKDELILAALQLYDGRFRNNFMKDVEALGATPQARLLAIFDAAETWFNSQNFFGCMFVNVVGEYSDPTLPMRAISRNFKQMIHRYILELCEKSDAKNPEILADEMALLFEGAIVTAQISGTAAGAKTAKAIAKQLLANHL